MMKKIIVDLPSDQQIEYSVKPSAINAPGNGYTGPGTVLWNELVNGNLPGGYDVPGGWISDGQGGLEFNQTRKDDHDAAVAALNIPKVVQMWALKEAVKLKEILDTGSIANLTGQITSAMNSEMDAVLKIQLQNRWDNKRTIEYSSPLISWAITNVTPVNQAVVDEIFVMAGLIGEGIAIDPETWTYP